jgi:hypothetical protein
MAEHMEQFDFSVPEFWALIGHLKYLKYLKYLKSLKWVRLQKNGKSRSIYDAGWSSLVARRAHNPEVVGSNPTPATKIIDSQGLVGCYQQALLAFGKDLGKKSAFPPHLFGHSVPNNFPSSSAASRSSLVKVCV